VGTLAETSATGGFVIAPEFDRGVARNGIMFVLSSGQTLRRLNATGDASIFDDFTGRGFFLGDSVSVIDVKTGTLVTKMSVPGAKESGVADGAGRIYLNIVRKDSVIVIDATTLRRLAEYSVSPARAPMGLAIDRKHRRLFVACDGKLVVLDADSGRIVTMLSVPGHSDQNAFDGGTGLLFEPGGAGYGLTIIHEDTPDAYSVVQTISDTSAASIKVIVDTLTHFVYVPHYIDDQTFRFIVLKPKAR